jgi:hypothetical protein
MAKRRRVSLAADARLKSGMTVDVIFQAPQYPSPRLLVLPEPDSTRLLNAIDIEPFAQISLSSTLNWPPSDDAACEVLLPLQGRCGVRRQHRR